MDKSKVTLPWGVSNTQLQPSSLGGISDSKLASFNAGGQKKSRFQKAREGSYVHNHTDYHYTTGYSR